MTRAERDTLRELLGIATHGAESPLPWQCDGKERIVVDDEGDAVVTRDGLPFDTANALALTVAAVNALGSLLDAADERDRLREAVEEVRMLGCDCDQGESPACAACVARAALKGPA